MSRAAVHRVSSWLQNSSPQIIVTITVKNPVVSSQNFGPWTQKIVSHQLTCKMSLLPVICRHLFFGFCISFFSLVQVFG